MYAIIGDIHSEKDDLRTVLQAIHELDEDLIVVGTGDLYECTVSKKDITDEKFHLLNEVMLYDEELERLLNFPSVYGNQEERILFITESNEALRQEIRRLPETMSIDGAMIIHGHQWAWGGDPWSLQKANTDERLTFFGHSHRSALSINDEWQTIDWDRPYDVSCGKVLVNVGSVIENREWVYYNPEAQTVAFKKVK